MKNTYLIFCFLLLTAGYGQEHKAEKHSGHEDPKEHAPGTANEYMHQTPVSILVERFESEARDSYQKPEDVLDYLGDLSGKTVMDIGAGSGYFSVRLAKRGAEVIAADVNEEFQAFLKERSERDKIQGLTTRKIPYDSPGLEEGEADIVLIVNTYHHIENRPDYFAKVRKGTKQDGKLVVIDYFDADIPVGPRHHKISMDTVISELKKAGYSQFEAEVSLLPYQYIITAR